MRCKIVCNFPPWLSSNICRLRLARPGPKPFQKNWGFHLFKKSENTYFWKFKNDFKKWEFCIIYCTLFTRKGQTKGQMKGQMKVKGQIKGQIKGAYGSDGLTVVRKHNHNRYFGPHWLTVVRKPSRYFGPDSVTVVQSITGTLDWWQKASEKHSTSSTSVQRHSKYPDLKDRITIKSESTAGASDFGK